MLLDQVNYKNAYISSFGGAKSLILCFSYNGVRLYCLI